MSSKEKDRPKRAVKGTIGSAMLLRLPEDWARAIAKAAKAHKPRLSAAEWVRRLIQEKLGL